MRWSTQTAERLARCPVGPVSPAPSEAESELLKATGGRGLPVMGGVVWGAAAAKAAAPDAEDHRPEEGELFALSPDGPWYLMKDGALLHPEEGIIASNWRAEVERRAWREGPWSDPSLVLYPPVGLVVAEGLGLPWREEASDEAGLTYGGERGWLVEEDHRCRVWLRHRDDLVEALRLSAEAGALVELVSQAPLGPDEPPPPPSAPAVYRREREGVTLSIWVEATGVHRRVERRGRVVDAQWIGPDAQLVQPPIPASTALPALSSRARAWLDEVGAVFDAGLTASPEQLRAELEARGLEINDALATLETKVGGVLVPHAHDPGLIGPLHLGTLQMLWAPDFLRRRLRGDGEEEPWLTPAVWPQMAFGAELLTLVGLQHAEERLYCDRAGAIYRYAGEYDLFRIEAGSIDTWLAAAGLRAEVRRENPALAWMRVKGSLAARLAEALGLSRVTDASDHVMTHYVAGGTWVWQQHAVAPNVASTYVVVPGVDRAVEVARRLSAMVEGDTPIEVQTAGPGGAARLKALQAAGLRVRAA